MSETIITEEIAANTFTKLRPLSIIEYLSPPLSFRYYVRLFPDDMALNVVGHLNAFVKYDELIFFKPSDQLLYLFHVAESRKRPADSACTPEVEAALKGIESSLSQSIKLLEDTYDLLENETEAIGQTLTEQKSNIRTLDEQIEQRLESQRLNTAISFAGLELTKNGHYRKKAIIRTQSVVSRRGRAGQGRPPKVRKSMKKKE